MVVSKKWKNSLGKRKNTFHNRKVNQIKISPEEVIEDLGKIILIKTFPKNWKKNEIGDLIIVTRKQNRLDVYVLEITFGGGAKVRKDCTKLKKSRAYFSDKRNALYFLRQNGVDPTENNFFIIHGIIVWYGTQFFHEKPIIIKNFELKSA